MSLRVISIDYIDGDKPSKLLVEMGTENDRYQIEVVVISMDPYGIHFGDDLEKLLADEGFALLRPLINVIRSFCMGETFQLPVILHPLFIK